MLLITSIVVVILKWLLHYYLGSIVFSEEYMEAKPM
jgi:hypothetical protein